jgi:hypothetical protein
MPRNASLYIADPSMLGSRAFDRIEGIESYEGLNDTGRASGVRFKTAWGSMTVNLMPGERLPEHLKGSRRMVEASRAATSSSTSSRESITSACALQIASCPPAYNLRMSPPESESAFLRQHLIKTWTRAWTEGLWYAAWSRVLDDLTPQQIAWAPPTTSAGGGSPEAAAGKRHCIWQIIDHMMFWRDVALRRSAPGGGAWKPTDAEIQAANFRAVPQPATAATLEDLRRRWRDSYDRVVAALNDPAADLTELRTVAYHDSYHIGQIMTLRGMLGLKAIE